MLKKKIKTITLIFTLIVLLTSLSFATTDEAVVTSLEDATVISEGDIAEENVDGSEEYYQDLFSDDLYKIDENIEIDNLIDGNAYLLGSNVTVNGQIGGDLFVIAQNVNLTQESYIYGNLFIVADSITIDGIVCDLYSISNTLNINENGVVLRDMRSTSGNINLNGSIGRNTYIISGNLVVGETAVVYGNLNYETSEAITVPEGVVSGDINFSQAVVADTSNTVTDYIISWVSTLLFTLTVFGLLLLIAPKFVAKAEEAIHKNALATLGIGALTWIIIIVVMTIALFLLISVVGSSLAFVTTLLCLIPLTIAKTLSIISISNLLGNKVKVFGKAHNLLAIILVSTIVWALGLIPFFVGTVISILVMLFGLGLFARSIFRGKNKEENAISE